MYTITKPSGELVGITESLTYIKLHPNGGFTLAGEGGAGAIGIAYRSKPYNLIGHDAIDGADTVVVSEMDSGAAAEAIAALLGGMSELGSLAVQFRRVIQKFADTLEDAEALEVSGIYDEWTPGVECYAGRRIRYRDKLYKVKEGQAHTALAGWEPDVAVSMFECIDVDHAGTADDPIHYEGNMVLENGLYYEEDGEVYKCTRDSVNALHAPLCDLVGIYVELL